MARSLGLGDQLALEAPKHSAASDRLSCLGACTAQHSTASHGTSALCNRRTFACLEMQVCRHCITSIHTNCIFANVNLRRTPSPTTNIHHHLPLLFSQWRYGKERGKSQAGRQAGRPWERLWNAGPQRPFALMMGNFERGQPLDRIASPPGHGLVRDWRVERAREPASEREPQRPV